MPKSEVFCMDCLEAMRKMPDNFFDVACVDPPYGDACSQYVNVERERERERGKWNRFGQRFDRYKETAAPLPRREQERQGPVEQVPPGRHGVMSTGGVAR